VFLLEAYDRIATWHAERWLWRYERATWVRRTAMNGGVRLDRGIWTEERARMREELSEYASRIPPYARHEKYDQAVRWAAR
jgi:hypothetical protein